MTIRRISRVASGMVLAGALMFSVSAGAVMLSLDTSTPVVSVGDSLSVDINISGLGSGAPDTLGGFDIDITSDPAFLGFGGYGLGSGLGDPALDVLDFSGGSDGAGTINLNAISLLLPSDLEAAQPAAFTLATLSFQATAPGTTVLDFSLAVLSDNFGILALTVDSTSPLSILIEPAKVLEPGTLVLFALGVAWMVFKPARRHRVVTGP